MDLSHQTTFWRMCIDADQFDDIPILGLNCLLKRIFKLEKEKMIAKLLIVTLIGF